MKKRVALAASVAALALVALTTTPASAVGRVLPDGEKFYAFNCDVLPFGLMVDVDVTTGVGTPIGSGTTTTHSSCAGQAAYDPTSGYVYWISWPGANGDGSETLMKADLATGTSIEVGQFSAYGGANAIAIDNLGNAYAIEDQGTSSDPTYDVDKLFSLDLATANMTFIANVQNGSTNCGYTFAFNPKDGNFYYSCYDAPHTSQIERIDVTNGNTTVVCDTGSVGPFGFGFDSNGIAWSPTDSSYSGKVVSFDITASDCGMQTGALMTVASNPGWFTESNVIIYVDHTVASDSELPATGLGSSFAVAGIASFALVALGAFLVIARRRRA